VRLTKKQQRHLDKLYAQAIDLQEQRAAVPSSTLRQPEWERLHAEYLKVFQQINDYIARIKVSHVEPKPVAVISEAD
jgi:hypothetical protein